MCFTPDPPPAIQRGIDRPPDDTHPALADLLDEAILGQHSAGLKVHGATTSPETFPTQLQAGLGYH